MTNEENYLLTSKFMQDEFARTGHYPYDELRDPSRYMDVLNPIYPWHMIEGESRIPSYKGNSNPSRINPSDYSPLLFPRQTSPINQAEFTPKTFGGGVVLDTEPYVSDRDRRIQAIDQRIANSPIPIESYVSPKMADTQTNSSFMNNLGGLLFGGGGDGMESYLSQRQQDAIQRQAMMQAAASLLKSSGVSTTPISLGQALGGAYEAGTAGYQQAQQGAVNQLLTRQKLDEYKRKQDIQKYFMSRMPGMTTGAAPAPQTAPSIQTMPTDGSAEVLPNVAVTSKPRPDIFSTLTPDQMALIAMDTEKMLPKVFEESLKTESFNTLTPSEVKSLGLDPRGKWQQNSRTGQITSLQAAKDEYAVVTGLEAEKLGLSGLGKWQVNKTNNQATLVPDMPGTFGGGLQGKAYDIILEGVNSGKTDTVQYALAHRELSKPVPMEQVQPDGSIKVVYTQPEPLPASIPKPTYRGNIPQVKTQATVVPSGATQTAPVAPQARSTVDANVIQPGVKSDPYTATSGQITEAKKQILVADKLVSAIDVLEKDIKQNGMQIGGLGEAGGRQEAFFQDALLQLKELQNLGVLNGPDERILLNQLADPTSLISFIKGKGGPEYVLSKITELRNKANREVDLINKQFARPITPPRVKEKIGRLVKDPITGVTRYVEE